MNGEETLGKVADGTQSELIRFFIIIAVILIIIVPSLIMYYRYKLKKDLEKVKAENKIEIEKIKLTAGLESTQFKDWTEREKIWMQVVKENGNTNKEVAQALTKLSVVLEINNKNSDVHKAEQMDKWNKMEADIRNISNDIRVLSNQMDAGLDGNWNALQDNKSLLTEIKAAIERQRE